MLVFGVCGSMGGMSFVSLVVMTVRDGAGEWDIEM